MLPVEYILTLCVSERIAYGKVEGKRLLERLHVVIATMTGVVGRMDAYAKVAAYNKHAYVETQTHSGTHGQIAEECAPLKLSTRTVGVVLQQPHITGIKEEGAVNGTEYRETVLGIALKLKRTGFIEIAVDIVLIGMITARTDAADGKRTHRVGTTHIELLAVRHLVTVAVGMSHAAKHSRHKPMLALYPSRVDNLSRTL